MRSFVYVLFFFRAFSFCDTTYKVDDYVLVSSDINDTEDVAKVCQLKDLIDNGEYSRALEYSAGFDDSLKMIFHMSHKILSCTFSLELPFQVCCNEGSQHRF